MERSISEMSEKTFLTLSYFSSKFSSSSSLASSFFIFSIIRVACWTWGQSSMLLRTVSTLSLMLPLSVHILLYRSTNVRGRSGGSLVPISSRTWMILSMVMAIFWICVSFCSLASILISSSRRFSPWNSSLKKVGYRISSNSRYSQIRLAHFWSQTGASYNAEFLRPLLKRRS